MRNYVQGYMTLGYIVDNGVESNYLSCPHDKLVVRVPEFHGLNLDQSKIADAMLPFSSFIIPPGRSMYEKGELYKCGSIVYVSLPSGSPAELLVTGVKCSVDDLKDSAIDFFNSQFGMNFQKNSVNAYTEGYEGGKGDKTGPYESTTPDTVPVTRNRSRSLGQIFGVPTEQKVIVNEFVKDPLHNRVHYGIDLAWEGCEGTRVCPVYDGKVCYVDDRYDANSGWNHYDKGFLTHCTDGGGYGNNIVIDHGVVDGKRVYSRYANLNFVKVKFGDRVKGYISSNEYATVIGDLGSSGNSTGPHLHLEILIGGTVARENAVDPRIYINFN